MTREWQLVAEATFLNKLTCGRKKQNAEVEEESMTYRAANRLVTNACPGPPTPEEWAMAAALHAGPSSVVMCAASCP